MFFFMPHYIKDDENEKDNKEINKTVVGDSESGVSGVTSNQIDINEFKQTLQSVKKQMDNKELDEIPLYARPKMLDFDYDKDSYIIVSYSRKDFLEVYLFLAHLYNNGYRFWYDNGMKGTRKWIEEYKEKFLNDNCLGTITFFSDNYISDSTKEELSIIYEDGRYKKKNDMISLISLDNMDADKMLKTATFNDRITLENAVEIKPVLSDIIKEEKQKTIHRYNDESDIPFLTDKVGKDFNIRNLTTNNILIEKSNSFLVKKGALLAYVGKDKNVSIPEGVVSIKENAFQNCAFVETVKMPNTIIEIEEGAFCGCVSLIDILMSNNIINIGKNAFKDCRSIKNIILPSTLKTIGRAAFYNCVSMESIILPEQITCVESSTFENCSLLKTIMLSSKLVSIERDVFRNCRVLKIIALPNTIKSIKNNAFYNCISLHSIMFDGECEEWNKVHISQKWNYESNINSIQCVDGTVCVDTQKDIDSFEVNINSDTVKNLVCSKIKNTFDECQNSLDDCEHLGDLYIKGKSLIEYAGEKEVVEISNNLTSIGPDAFCNNTIMKQVIIPDSVTYIGSRAFESCVSLNNVTIGNGVKTIGGGAFSKCRELTEVVLPESIKNINSGAFSSCNSLTTVIIPKGIKQIKDYAFAGCALLENLIYNGKKEEWERVAIGERIGKSIKRIKCIDGDIEI